MIPKGCQSQGSQASVRLSTTKRSWGQGSVTTSWNWKTRRLQDAQAKAAKCQLPSVRQKEAEAKAAEHQSPSVWQKEAEAKAAKCQLPSVRQNGYGREATMKSRRLDGFKMLRPRQPNVSCSQCNQWKLRLRQPSKSVRLPKRRMTGSKKMHSQGKGELRMCWSICNSNNIIFYIGSRQSQLSLMEASHAFISATKEGPEYICMSCNRLMYRKIVQEFQVFKYDKAPEEFVVHVPVSAQDKEWICKTCHNALRQGVLPAQAKANNLGLDDIPVELSDLNPLEVCLISLRIPFMISDVLPYSKLYGLLYLFE